LTSARAAIQRVRAALEESFAPDHARALMFDALSEWGPGIPATHQELVRFVRGPLRRRLVTVLGREQSVPPLIRIEHALAVVDSTDEEQFSPRPSSRPPPPLDANSTWALQPMGKLPVRVAVLSRSDSVGQLLQLALGPELLQIRDVTVDSLPTALGKETDLLVVDGIEPPTIEPTTLARTLSSASQNVWLTIWGAEQPFANDVAKALEACGVHCVPLVSTEGIAPFIDLVRARRG